MKEFFTKKKPNSNDTEKPTGSNSGNEEEVLLKIMDLNISNKEKDQSVASTKNNEIDNLLRAFNVEGLKKFQACLVKKIKQIEEEAKESSEAFDKLWNTIGNILHPDVVVSDDEANNKVIKVSGDVSQKKKYSHVDLCEMIDGYDPVRGSKVMGSRGYFLKGPLFLLSQALQLYAIQFMHERDFTPIQTPYLMKKKAMDGVAQQSQYDEELYKVTGKWTKNAEDEKYLIATSEQPLCAMFTDEYLEVENEPLKVIGYSTCFRQEAGSHGRDTKGIFRVHQFEKIEQFIYCNPTVSYEQFDVLLNNVYGFYESLNIPYRTVSIVSGELNNAAAIKYDVEGYFPSGQTFRELVSCSNCTDYQSRAANVRCGVSGTAKAPFVHMLNSTLCAVTRTLCILLELNQTEEGINIPEPLQKFMVKKYEKFIPFVKQPPVPEA